MRLVSARIQNFRGITDLSINFDDFTSIIGPNNAGKSTILHALRMVLGRSAPSLQDFRRKGDRLSPCICISYSYELESDETVHPDATRFILDGRMDFRSEYRLEPDKPIPPELGLQEDQLAALDDSAADLPIDLVETLIARKALKVSKGQHFYRTQYISEELSSLVEKGEIEPILEILNIEESFIEPAWRNKTGKKPLSKDGKTKMIEALLQQNLLTEEQTKMDWVENIQLPMVFSGYFGSNVAFIEAMQSVDDFASTKNEKTLLTRVVKDLLLGPIQSTPAYIQLAANLQGVRNAFATVEQVQAVSKSLSNTLGELLGVHALFECGEMDVAASLHKSVSLRLTPSSEEDSLITDIAYQGHGTQRTVAFALIKLLSEGVVLESSAQGAESARFRKILCFEEPELFIHPQLLLELRAALTRMVKSGGWQVICTTHSPYFVSEDVADSDASLFVMNRSGAGVVHTQSTGIHTDLNTLEESRKAFKSLMNMDPNVCSAFFGEFAVLVEGPTEVAVLSLRELKTLLPEELRKNASKCAIVNCLGKGTIPAFIDALSRYGIPVTVIHDLDINHEAENAGNNAAILEAANRASRSDVNKLVRVDSTFEHLFPSRLRESFPIKHKPFTSWRTVKGELAECASWDDLKSRLPNIAVLAEEAFSDNNSGELRKVRIGENGLEQ